MPSLAIILARAGSKGLPGKNAAMVAGRPCIAWTIEAAQRARSISRVAVSTDGKDLQEIALDMRADVIARPSDLASDTATIDAAARHAVAMLDDRATDRCSEWSVRPIGSARPSQAAPTGPEPPVGGTDSPIIILYANVPVRPPDLIDRAVDLLVSSRADSVQSYAPVGKHHPWWTARIDPETGRVRPWEGDILNHNTFRRQDLPAAHIPDGGIIALTRAALFLRIPGVTPGPHAFFGRETHRRGIVNPEGSVVDIDSEIDLIVADAMLSRRAGAPGSG